MPITRSKKPPKKPYSRSGSRSTPDPEPEPVNVSSRPRQPRRSPSKPKVTPERFSILDQIPPERRMDILGVVLAIAGLLTLLSLFSANKSRLTGPYTHYLMVIFGWAR